MTEAAINELVSLFLSESVSNSSVAKFELETQEHLTRNDEIMALVDSARLEIQHTTDVAFVNLVTQTKVCS